MLPCLRRSSPQSHPPAVVWVRSISREKRRMAPTSVFSFASATGSPDVGFGTIPTLCSAFLANWWFRTAVLGYIFWTQEPTCLSRRGTLMTWMYVEIKGTSSSSWITALPHDMISKLASVYHDIVHFNRLDALTYRLWHCRSWKLDHLLPSFASLWRAWELWVTTSLECRTFL